MKESCADELAQLAESRAQVYAILAALYLHAPSRELVTALLNLAASPALADLSHGAAVESLRHYAASYAGDLEGVQQEFHDLFTVPLGRYVTPYESVYRDERLVGEERVRGLLMGPSALAVVHTYRENGFALSPECTELPDHIGVELSFMSLLCRRECEARQASDATSVEQACACEVRFLEEHLLCWVPHLRERIAANASSDFYRGIAYLTEDFLSADRAIVAAARTQPAAASRGLASDEKRNALR
jgi:TorA maturation chaperone TorD